MNLSYYIFSLTPPYEDPFFVVRSDDSNEGTVLVVFPSLCY
jgi:hypothetical protein